LHKKPDLQLDSDIKKLLYAIPDDSLHEKPTNQSILLSLVIGKYLPGHFVPFL